MSSRSTRYAKAGLALAIMTALLAACGSAPPKSAPVKAPEKVASAPANAAPAPATASPAGPTAAAPGAPAADPNAPPPPPPVPDRAQQQYNQALSMMKSGRATDAELEFKQLAAAYPQFAGPQLNLGLLYLKDSRLKEAEGAFQAALKINPASAVAGTELGIVERRLGKFNEAETVYQKAIESEPNYAPAHLNLGVLYDLYLSQPQKALDEFQRYVELAGENKQVAGWVVELKKRVGAPPPKKEAQS